MQGDSTIHKDLLFFEDIFGSFSFAYHFYGTSKEKRHLLFLTSKDQPNTAKILFSFLSTFSSNH